MSDRTGGEVAGPGPSSTAAANAAAMTGGAAGGSARRRRGRGITAFDEEPLDAVLGRMKSAVQFQPWKGKSQQHQQQQHLNKEKQLNKDKSAGMVGTVAQAGGDGPLAPLPMASPLEAAAGVPAMSPPSMDANQAPPGPTSCAGGKTPEWRLESDPVRLQCR